MVSDPELSNWFKEIFSIMVRCGVVTSRPIGGRKEVILMCFDRYQLPGIDTSRLYEKGYIVVIISNSSANGSVIAVNYENIKERFLATGAQDIKFMKNETPIISYNQELVQFVASRYRRAIERRMALIQAEFDMRTAHE